ncbi:class F sortase [Streptomyces sp. NPDC088725]|uniref:class F sortase n=1 Tax=Streptomyces sp. NPDC088725 TaxID=3365873 RepID=UPI0037F44B00
MTTPTAEGRPPSSRQGGRPRHIRRCRPTRQGRVFAAAAAAAGIVLAAVGTSALVAAPHRTPARADIGSLPLPQGAADQGARTARAAPPVRIRIAGIGLDRPLTRLRIQEDGRLGAPENPSQVGWWSEGPRPGDPGAAIIVGHVDSATGPAAFYSLSSLRPGDAITVDRGDRSSVTFTVRALRQYEKDAFPDDQVYAAAGPPALRLITCGGTYDNEQGGYSDNVVLYATLAAPGTPKPSTPPSHTHHRSRN